MKEDSPVKAGGNVDFNEPGLQTRIQEDVKSKEFVAGVPATPIKLIFSSGVTLCNVDTVDISGSLHTSHANWSAMGFRARNENYNQKYWSETDTKSTGHLLSIFTIHYTCC